jgi:hypothetical protein
LDGKLPEVEHLGLGILIDGASADVKCGSFHVVRFSLMPVRKSKLGLRIAKYGLPKDTTVGPDGHYRRFACLKISTA